MLTGVEIARTAKEQLTTLTGLEANTVASLSNDEEGWHASVEMVELKRIPDAQTVLASYGVLLDSSGTVLRYQRTRRYLRGAVGEEP